MIRFNQTSLKRKKRLIIISIQPIRRDRDELLKDKNRKKKTKKTMILLDILIEMKTSIYQPYNVTMVS